MISQAHPLNKHELGLKEELIPVTSSTDEVGDKLSDVRCLSKL